MFLINMLKKDTDSAALFLKEVIPEPQGPGGNKSPLLFHPEFGGDRTPLRRRLKSQTFCQEPNDVKANQS